MAKKKQTPLTVEIFHEEIMPAIEDAFEEKIKVYRDEIVEFKDEVVEKKLNIKPSLT